MRLKDKVAIVTGSSKGIGLGIAQAFHREGAKLCIVSRHPEEGESVAKELGSEDGMSIYRRVDVKNIDDIKMMIDDTVETFGKLDCLVNNAGYFIAGNIEEISEDDWDYIQNTNLKSTFLCCKYAIPHLKKTKGNIINISSMAGVQGFLESAAYAPTKAGQLAITRGIAIDFGKDGIRANAICPGYIRTPLAEEWFKQLDKDPGFREDIIKRHLVGRYGNIDDCAGLAVFLASDEASFMTGAIIPVDGGVTLGY